MLIISFMGIDGSGKTTNAKWLVNWLREHGFKATYIWNRPYSRLAQIMSTFLMFIFPKKKKHMDSTSDSEVKEIFLKSGILTAIYKNVILLDFILSLYLRFFPSFILRKNAVFDRYIYDVVLDLSISLKYSAAQIRELVKTVSRAVPKPQLAFFLDVPESVAIARKQDIHSLDSLRIRRELYKIISSECNMIVIDGSKSLEEIQKEISSVINNFLGRIDQK